ncbi:N-formylglutamate amidohydrolase [Beijerinckia mobilis]|uniref:N-formylglutamate amidohydrolase n=1 Tax=Beijerinckia mobilis TaxID=231434 RepID=UPI00068AB82C|nr:N-formylglutamate amidohydrolase [Beijerinckia mobilis]
MTQDAQISLAREPSVERIEGRHDSGLLFLCDHASNHVPAHYAGLGLTEEDLSRHIAYDIGAAMVTRTLARIFSAPALLTCVSRLVIDVNRGSDDPTLVMRLSDGRIIPGNARVDAAEIECRLRAYWQPYRLAIRTETDVMLAQGPVPILVAIHSFTPCWKNVPRPWEVGVLWDNDPRFAKPLIEKLAEAGFCVGDNEPYDGALRGDTLNMEATRRGLPGVLVEIRQDCIATPEMAAAFAERLAGVLRPLTANPAQHTIDFFPSRTGSLGDALEHDGMIHIDHV